MHSVAFISISHVCCMCADGTCNSIEECDTLEFTGNFQEGKIEIGSIRLIERFVQSWNIIGWISKFQSDKQYKWLVWSSSTLSKPNEWNENRSSKNEKPIYSECLKRLIRSFCIFGFPLVVFMAWFIRNIPLCDSNWHALIHLSWKMLNGH